MRRGERERRREREGERESVCVDVVDGFVFLHPTHSIPSFPTSHTSYTTPPHSNAH